LPGASGQRGSVSRRLLRWLGLALLAWTVLTVFPVLLLRWVHPLGSAFMLEAQLAAWRAQDRAYHADIREAVRASEHGKRLRGASTISQQVAKNLFLWNGHSFLRKGLEAYFTVLIEALWPKERILEMYLNVAQFGDGIYGVQAAAERFWHKPASRLSSSEAAVLAAVLPNPHVMHADRPSRYVLQRRDEILAQMSGLGGEAYLHAVEGERRGTR
jgi:monofunctional biosynthetic peptidoglycan transglycosylase